MVSGHTPNAPKAIVNQLYPALRRKAEEDAEGLTPQITSCLPQCNSVYNSISENIRDDMAEKLQEELQCRILPHLPDVIETVGRLANSTLAEVKSVFSSIVENMNEKLSSASVSFANNIDTYFVNQMDRAPRTPEVMRNVFETANSIRTYEREALSKFPVIEYKDKLCILAQTLLDSSVLTFEVSCGDVVLKNNGFLEKAAVTKVEVHVLKKMQSYQDLVPQEIAHILLLSQIFADAIADRVQEVLDYQGSSLVSTTHTNSCIEQIATKQDVIAGVTPSLEQEEEEEEGPSASGAVKEVKMPNSMENIPQVTAPCIQDMETGEATASDRFNPSGEEKPSDC